MWLHSWLKFYLFYVQVLFDLWDRKFHSLYQCSNLRSCAKRYNWIIMNPLFLLYLLDHFGDLRMRQSMQICYSPKACRLSYWVHGFIWCKRCSGCVVGDPPNLITTIINHEVHFSLLLLIPTWGLFLHGSLVLSIHRIKIFCTICS